jgi:hypothetical protein
MLFLKIHVPRRVPVDAALCAKNSPENGDQAYQIVEKNPYKNLLRNRQV